MGRDGVNALEESQSVRSRLTCIVGDVADTEANRGIEGVNVDDGERILDDSVKVSTAESTDG